MMYFLRVFVLLSFIGLLSFPNCTAQNVPAKQGSSNTAPVITTPSDRPVYHVNDGDSFVLNCSATGSPKPTLKWSKTRENRPDIVLQMPPNVIQKKTTKGIELIFRNFSKGEEGSYACVAKNKVATSIDVFNLKVQYPGDVAPNITTLFKVYEVTVGGVLEMVCHATGSPSPQITWIKPRGQAISGGIITLKPKRLNNGIEELRLQIQKVSPETQGSYVCKASNRAGDEIRASYVQVQPLSTPKPPILTPLQDTIEITELPFFMGGNTAILLMFLKNTPIGSTVTWHLPRGVKISKRLGKKEDFEIRHQVINGVSHRFNEGTAYMYIKRVTHNDAGTYTCTVTTPANLTASRSVTLQVARPGPGQPVKTNLPCVINASSKKRSDFVILGN